MEQIIIKNNFTKRVNFGHLWIFSNELVKVPQLPAGEIVEVLNEKGHNYGLAFYNPHSLISARLLLTNNIPNKDFFESKIRIAYQKRMKSINQTESDSFRVIFGESDFLPGLVVDKYANYLSIQLLSAGMEKFKSEIIESLLNVIPNIKGIYEKSDSQTRKLEGLEESVGLVWGAIPSEFEMIENGLKYLISFEKGQKTGYFLDQKSNRKFLTSLTNGLSVLDCYTNQGGFILNAAKGGAKSMTAVDISAEAINRAKGNAKLNGYNDIECIIADVPEFLKKAIEEKRKWDMVILDPPSFAKSRKSIPLAKHAYSKINKLALQLLNSNGYLVSSSCTKHITEENLFDIVLFEAQKQSKRLTLIYKGTQPPDHPYLINMPETNYLKFFVFQLCD